MNQTMRRLKSSFGVLCIMFLLIACNSKQSKIEKSIEDLTNRFPQLPRIKSNYLKYYTLVRGIDIGNNVQLQLQLRVSPDSIEEHAEIIVLINSEGKAYSMPFFSNRYRDYWNFKFDELIPNLPLTGTTFENEFQKAMVDLDLDSSVVVQYKVIEEILESLLHSRRINRSDSSDLAVCWYRETYGVAVENSDSCFKRIKKNNIEIFEDFALNKPAITYRAYWDEKNGRVYKVYGFYDKKNTKIRMETFRCDCAWISISL